MPKVKLENVSFNKLKEFTSLGNKKNITIKGKFTLIGEYELLTKDGGDDSMTLKQLTKFTIDFAKKQEEFNKQVLKTLNLILDRLDKIETRLDKIETRLDRIVKLNNLKE